ncbi:hypothetical protein [Microbulbifer guangxiensis]|uniref:hypothetical protein n=1 Tax=Microbulbifer guangxiensis TaxID=2904249 RepID=UPI001F46AF46|nr:hypothetical protein [Microbulbifer guangxiensis]
MRKNLLFILLQSVLLCSAVLAEPPAQQDERLQETGGQLEVSTAHLLDTIDGDTDGVPPRRVALTLENSAPAIAKPFSAVALPVSPLHGEHAIRAPPFQA